MLKRETRYLPARELRITTAADGTKTLSGYAIVFNSRSVDLGGFVEVVSPDALKETLKGKPDVLCLNSHDNSQVLGRTKSGTLKLKPDSTGLAFSCVLDMRSTLASDLAISVERGDVSGCSFGFQTIKDAWAVIGGVNVRTLLQIEVFEISICSNPAYPDTDVAVRSCPKDLRSKIRSMSDDGVDDDDLDDDDLDDCDCDCPECLDGDCADCSDPDCDDPNCEHGENSARSIDLWRLNMQLAIAKRR